AVAQRRDDALQNLKRRRLGLHRQQRFGHEAIAERHQLMQCDESRSPKLEKNRQITPSTWMGNYASCGNFALDGRYAATAASNASTRGGFDRYETAPISFATARPSFDALSTTTGMCARRGSWSCFVRNSWPDITGII